MNAIRWTALFTLAVSYTALPAQCPSGNVSIASQADILAFGANFPGCDTLPGDLYISGNDITDLTPFSGLVVVQGDLTLYQTWPGPEDFSGFDALTRVDGDLVVYDVVRLKNFQGLGALHRIGGDFDVRFCDSLQGFYGCGQLSVVHGNLMAIYNTLMVGVGLAQLDTVHGDLVIDATLSPDLTLLNVPNDLEFVGGRLHLRAESATSIGGGNTLSRVGDDLVINYNQALQSISGFPALQVIGGDLSVQHNPQLVMLGGFIGLDSIGGAFRVNNDPLLNVLGGFPDLDAADTLYISNNPALTAVVGFAELDTVGRLIIQFNTALTSIAAFDHAVALGSLQIDANAQLSICHVQAVCDRLASPLMPVPGIFSNAPGCQSGSEVESFCTMTTGLAMEVPRSWKVHPVPASDLVYITPGEATGPIDVRLSDTAGRDVLTAHTASDAPFTMDVRALNAGIYVLCAVDGRGRCWTSRLVVD